jgi:DNA-3-methyladenine glycosylase
MHRKFLSASFFDRDPQQVAIDLLGKVLYVKHKNLWLKARIIETEAYYIHDKASHSSLGFTEKRKALFMPASTIYMYYARGNPSFNISCKGAGNAVLVKSGVIYFTETDSPSIRKKMLGTMQRLNPINGKSRPLEKLCSGQTLLCKSLGLRVKEWDQKKFDLNRCFIADVGIKVDRIIQTTRLGIPKGRDGHLPYRFIDYNFAKYCTKNPFRKKFLKTRGLQITKSPVKIKLGRDRKVPGPGSKQ